MRLEHENRMLKEKKDSGRGQDEVEVLKTVNAGLVERIERLETENRCSCRASQPRNSVSDCQTKASSASVTASMVASIKAKLESKPVFAGSLLTRQGASSVLQPATSCSQLSSVPYSRLSITNDTQGSRETASAGSHDPKFGVRERVERLKEAFLAGSSVSSISNSAQSSCSSSSRSFARSASYGYDKALGFATGAASNCGSTSSVTRPLVLDSPIARKWANTAVDLPLRSASVSSTNSKDSDVSGSRGSLLRPSSLQPPRRESDTSLCSRMDLSGMPPPPPPVEAVVITRDSSPRDETDSGYRGCDSLNYDESASPSRYSPEEDHFDEGLLLDFNPPPSSKKTSQHVRTPPDDSIEIDASFHDGRDSLDSASVSSFSIISETIASSDLFERSQSMILTPRSTRDSDTASTKSFGKSLKKRKMLKAAANAMFSLCGP